MTRFRIPLTTLACAAFAATLFWLGLATAAFLFPIATLIGVIVLTIVCLWLLFQPEKPAKPLIPANLRDKSGRFVKRRPILHAALRRDVEAK